MEWKVPDLNNVLQVLPKLPQLEGLKVSEQGDNGRPDEWERGSGAGPEL
jgi:hypothetical protein